MAEDKEKKARYETGLGNLYDLGSEGKPLGSELSNPSYHELVAVGERYDREQVLGEGGMKRIFRVFDRKTKRHLAMATLRSRAGEDFYDPLIHEAWLCARLDHPNIIKVHDLAVDQEGRPFFTMDLKTGVSLQDIIDGLRRQDEGKKVWRPLEVRLEAFLKGCDAISFAHSRGVLHLDLKPDNVQVGEFGEVLVCDWGLGKFVGEGEGPEWGMDEDLLHPDVLAGLTLTGQVRGTPGYMAPEQVEASREKSARTDVYGLGGMLYALLVLEPVLLGDTTALLEATSLGRVPPPKSRNRGAEVSEGLNRVVMKALATSPENRYSSVDELRMDVRRHVDGYRMSVERVSALGELLRLWKRNRGLCVSILASLAVVAVVSAFFIVGLDRSRRATERAMQESEVLSESVVQALLEQSHVFSDNFFFGDPVGSVEKALEYLEKALVHDPTNRQLLGQKAYVLVIAQRFEEANACFAQSADIAQEIAPLSRRWVGEPRDKDGLMEPERLAEFILEMRGNKKPVFALVTRMIRYSKVVQMKSADRYVRPVAALIAINSPGWDMQGFQYRLKERTLTVKGEGMVRLRLGPGGIGRSYLRFLPLDHLVLDGVEVYMKGELNGLELRTLDIRGANLRNYYFLQEQIGLRKLTIRKGQLSPREREVIPDWVMIEESG